MDPCAQAGGEWHITGLNYIIIGDFVRSIGGRGLPQEGRMMMNGGDGFSTFKTGPRHNLGTLPCPDEGQLRSASIT